MKEKPIYTIGHRNPDTDSICSAIGYAHLKRALGENVLPARAGKMNAETKYVLEKFSIDTPKLITDLFPRVKDVLIETKAVVKEHDTLRKLGQIMREHDVKSVPVVNDEEVLVGIVTVSDLAKRYFNELGMQNLADANVTLSLVVEVLDAKIVHSVNLNKKVEGEVRIAAGSHETIHSVIKKGDVVLVGDRENAMISCVNEDISCLVVTGNAPISQEVLDIAKEKDILVVTSPYDTYTCARMVNQCVPVSRIMQKDVTNFKPTDLLSDIKTKIELNKYRNYPVVENNKLIGIVSRDQLAVPEREKVILVDHNERSQAVEGIEEARIMEIIDHHRLGGLQTSEPIFIRNEQVGCTATIVANMHWHRGVEIPHNIAGILLSAIISDTVLFKSPTCTQYDKETAERLAKIAGLEINSYGMALLKAGSGIGNMSSLEIAKNDLKEFNIGDYRMIVSQLSVMDESEVLAIKADIIESMKVLATNEGYNMALLMVTNILEQGTHLLFIGEPQKLIKEAFGVEPVDNMVYLPGVMSRKKQVIPPMGEAARRI